MYQWRNVISQYTGGTMDPATGIWTGGASCIMVDGRDRDKRDQQYARAIKERPTYTIISYSQVTNDYHKVTELPWDFGIVDEITYIKSFDSDRTQAMKTLLPGFRFGLTGDPVENSPEDLFCIMEWIDPTVLGDWELFDNFYCVRTPQGWVRKAKNLDVLHQVMNDAEAWFVKKEDDKDVAPYMPKRKPPIVLHVELDDAAAEVYDIITSDLMVDLEELSRSGMAGIDVAAMYGGLKGAKGAHGRAAAKLMALRMLCADPYVLRQSARRFINAPEKPKKLMTITRRDGQRIKVMKAPPKPGSAYVASLMDNGWITPDNLSEHPKMDVVMFHPRYGLDALLEKDPKNKIVVFSYFKDVLAWLAAQYEGENVIHNGDMSAKNKDAAKRQFQMDPGTRLFLSSDSGAYGVDLPQANILMNYDTPYSAGPKRQRDARIVRGSSLEFWSHIQIIDVLVDGSVEEHYHDKTMRRIELGDAIKTGRASQSEVKMTAMSLSQFLETHVV